MNTQIEEKEEENILRKILIIWYVCENAIKFSKTFKFSK